jgi:DNA repair photolyase
MDGFRVRRAENPDNRFETLSLEWEEGVERPQEMRVYREEAKSILSRNDSPDLPFTWSVNPYRGCAHACAYCYARPYHEYLGWGAGTDFDTRIVAKMNAAELLDRELSKPSWTREALAFSGVTDCYQPAEQVLGLTRRCLEAALRHHTPVGVITKSSLALRDLDLLRALAQGPGGNAVLSIPFDDAAEARGIEPFASPPAARFAALEKLSAAGIRTGISVGPVIPGWNDSAIPRILKRAGECGASFAFYVLLRLPGSVEKVFLSRLRTDFPERYGKVEHHLRETHGGELKQTGFGTRMRGQGKMADVIEDLFLLHARKNGLAVGERMAGIVPREGMVEAASKKGSAVSVAQSKIRQDSSQTSLFDP